MKQTQGRGSSTSRPASGQRGTCKLPVAEGEKNVKAGWFDKVFPFGSVSKVITRNILKAMATPSCHSVACTLKAEACRRTALWRTSGLILLLSVSPEIFETKLSN